MHQEKNPTTVNKLRAQIRESPYRTSILHFLVTHNIVWVLQDAFLNDHLLKKDDPLQSSAIQRNWHHPPKNWDLILQKLHGGDWHEMRSVEYVNSFNTIPKARWSVETYWWNLVSQWYDG